MALGTMSEQLTTSHAAAPSASSVPPFLPTRHGFNSYYGLPYSNDMKPAPLMRDEKIIDPNVDLSTLATRYTAEALRFLDAHTTAPGSAPFFLYLAHNSPHVPLHPSPNRWPTTPSTTDGDVRRVLACGQRGEATGQDGRPA